MSRFKQLHPSGHLTLALQIFYHQGFFFTNVRQINLTINNDIANKSCDTSLSLTYLTLIKCAQQTDTIARWVTLADRCTTVCV